MSVREYIGARYVPLFADPIDWDSTKTYEPLTIVYNQGNSYTSRQYVPAGIDISNDVYWAKTGNYNAQIEQYRSEVATFDDRITTNENRITTNETNLRDILPFDETPTEGSAKGVTSDGIKKAIDTAEQANADAIAIEVTRATAAEKVNADAIANEVTRATAAEKVNADAIANEVTRATAAEKVNADAIAIEVTRATAAEKVNADAINKLKNEQGILLALGDSFGVDEVSRNNWWHTYVAKGLGLLDINYCEGSDGFAATNPTSGRNFLDRLNEAYNDSSFDNNKVEYVICYGGLNDRNLKDFNVIDQAIVAFINRMNELYPRAKKIIAGPTSWFQASRNSTSDTVFATFNEAMGSHMRKMCAENGVTYISMTYETILTPSAYAGMTDGYHFTKRGSAMAAASILSGIQGRMMSATGYTVIPGHYVDPSNNMVTDNTHITLRKTASGFKVIQSLVKTKAAVNGVMRFVSDTNYFFRFLCQDINAISYWGGFDTTNAKPFVDNGRAVIEATDNTVLGIGETNLNNNKSFSYTIDYIQW